MLLSSYCNTTALLFTKESQKRKRQSPLKMLTEVTIMWEETAKKKNKKDIGEKFAWEISHYDISDRRNISGRSNKLYLFRVTHLTAPIFS